MPSAGRNGPARACSLWFVAAAAVACGADDLVLPRESIPAAIEVLRGDRQMDTVGRTLRDTLIVRLTDSRNRPVKYQPVRFAQLPSSVGALLIPDSTQTDADGRAKASWVLGTAAGQQAIRVRVGVPGGELALDVSAAALADLPDTLVSVSGDAQSGVVDSDLSQPLVASVTDRFGNPIGGVTVGWTAVGGGSVSPSTAVSGPDGRVAARRTLGPTAGQQSAVAAAPGLKGSPLSFIQTSTPGEPAALVAESGNGQSGPVGMPLAQPLIARLVDARGNGIAGRVVAWPVATGGGSVTAASGLTDAAGRATANWTIGPIAGPNSVIPSATGFFVTFTAMGLSTPAAAIAASSPTQLGGTAGIPVSPTPSVKVTDAQNQPVAGVTVTFAVTSGNGTVVPNNALTSANGIATVTSWVLGPQVGSNTLTATAAGPLGPLSGSPVLFTAQGSAGDLSKLTIVVQPSATGVSGVPLAQAPAVQVQDVNGNNISLGGAVVTATLVGSPAGASLASATATTDAAGRAVFAGLTILGPPATYTLLFTSSPPLTGAISSGITLAGPLGTRLALTTQPSPAVSSGQVFPVQPVVQVLDSGGAAVAQPGVVCTVTLATGNPALVGVLTAISDGSGAARFTNLTISGIPGPRTLLFSATGLTPVTSNTVTVSGVVPPTISIVTQPSASVPNGAVFPTQPVALVQDANGNPVGGASVSAAVAMGGGTISGQLTVSTDGAGRATFNNLALTGTVGSYALVLRAGEQVATTAAILLTPGPASPLTTIATVPSPVKMKQPVVIVVQTRDQSGNNLTIGGRTVVMTVTGKNPTGPITAIDSGNGNYTATYTPGKKGVDLATITLDGTPISGSPYTIMVQ